MARLTTRFDWPKVVVELRMKKFFTQKELAHELGCTPATVGKWERGETVPTPGNLRRLHEVGVALGFPSAQWPQLKASR